jgi:PAS domain S-box-containing protein
VTDRTLASDRLRDSEERLREIANNIDQFAWTCNELGLGTWYNDRWYDYTGTTFEQMQADGWQSFVHPEHVSRVVNHLKMCLARGAPWEDTFPLKSKDGHFRWFLSRAVPIRDESGRVRRWFGTNTDVTDLRELQEALRAADRRKDEFLAMLAHELRNPVAPIMSAAEALSRLLLEQQHRGLIDIVRRQAQSLSRLLDDLLDVARITQGRIQLHREVVTVVDCLALAVETTQPLIREKGHNLTVTPSMQPQYVHADRIRLAQCLTNLLSNAAKYTAPGGDIRVRSFTDNREVEIEVTDTGAGIDAEFLPHVFGLFAQGERGLDRSQGGLGVGLSVCKQLIEMQGGTVRARSAGLGRGSTFALRLPLWDQDSADTMAGAMTADGPRLRILVVDDNEDAAESLAMLLTLEGHQVRAAYSAQFALAELPAFVPHVALLDIGLPDMTGYELARQMRVAAGDSLRLIAVSGYGQPEDRMHSQSAGFNAHLVKPVRIEDLLSLLASEKVAR